MQPESLAKAYILTHGIRFSSDALRLASLVNAKRQNAVYNLPAQDVDKRVIGTQNTALQIIQSTDRMDRPQELLLTGSDGYTVCVSAVAPVPCREPAYLDFFGGQLRLATPSWPNIGQSLESVSFVTQPMYYNMLTTSGRPVQRWVSACGYNEMNIWPWHDCAISRPCNFCGINMVQKRTDRDVDFLHALELRRESDAERVWSSIRDTVISEITEAVGLAIDDDCYREAIYLILISGNLADHQLDDQARIYSDIAKAIIQKHPERFADGVVAVTAPPKDLGLLSMMKDCGIDVGVFNLEAFTPDAFTQHCPGKDRIGRNHYLKTLEKGVEVFGWGNSWCNFVLGLEPVAELLSGCEELAFQGVTPGANVLHRDYGASQLHNPPDLETVIGFYRNLAEIYRRHKHQPYYSQLALRTSLANEAFAGRLN